MSTACSLDTLYLQPHLLTKVSLIRLLEQRCMNIKHLNIMSKEQLIDLFQRIALPLPQRKYKQNYRGKLLTKLRNEKESHKQKSEDNSSNISYGFSDKRPVKSSMCPGIIDRLKPPPDTVNFEKKKIRLSGNSSKSNDLDHIHIKKRRSDATNGFEDDDKQDANGAHKSNTSLSTGGSSSSHKVTLKRSHSSYAKRTDVREREPVRKKEKKPITWP